MIPVEVIVSFIVLYQITQGDDTSWNKNVLYQKLVHNGQISFYVTDFSGTQVKFGNAKNVWYFFVFKIYLPSVAIYKGDSLRRRLIWT